MGEMDRLRKYGAKNTLSGHQGRIMAVTIDIVPSDNRLYLNNGCWEILLRINFSSGIIGLGNKPRKV
jgi:hypothetical protein